MHACPPIPLSLLRIPLLMPSLSTSLHACVLRWRQRAIIRALRRLSTFSQQWDLSCAAQESPCRVSTSTSWTRRTARTRTTFDRTYFYSNGRSNLHAAVVLPSCLPLVPSTSSHPASSFSLWVVGHTTSPCLYNTRLEPQ